MAGLVNLWGSTREEVSIADGTCSSRKLTCICDVHSLSFRKLGGGRPIGASSGGPPTEPETADGSLINYVIRDVAA